MDEEICEATAALKGMLGIGSTPNSAETPSEPKTETKKPKKKKAKKKKQSENNDAKETTNEKQSAEDGKKNAENTKKNAPSTKKKKKKKKKDATDQQQPTNYAWSAFQSSPDASKLPIPSFSSPTQEKKVLATPPTQLPESIQPLSHKKQPDSKTPDENASKAPAEEEAAPSSETGVNLAALAATNNLTSPPPSQQHNSASPVPFTPPQMPPYNHQYGAPPQPYAIPPPPPGYVLIQVQVPTGLMPGQQMYVQSPSGYPVQITIPDNAQPGTILPVHVPAPMHMMPPVPPQYPGNYY